MTRNGSLDSHCFNTDCLHMQDTEDRCKILSSDFEMTVANKEPVRLESMLQHVLCYAY